MYVRDHLRTGFFEALGFDVDDFDQRVIKLTNTISEQVFPHTIDTDNPRFWALLEQMYQHTVALEENRRDGGSKLRGPGAQGGERAGPSCGCSCCRCGGTTLPANVRLDPVW